jgi:hypothetical protein
MHVWNFMIDLDVIVVGLGRLAGEARLSAAQAISRGRGRFMLGCAAPGCGPEPVLTPRMAPATSDTINFQWREQAITRPGSSGAAGSSEGAQ